MKNNDIGYLFKINNVCNTVKKADIYLVPGSKETAKQMVSSPSSCSLGMRAGDVGRGGSGWITQPG